MAAGLQLEILSSLEFAAGLDDPKIAILEGLKSRIRLCTAHLKLQSKLSLNIRQRNCRLIEPFANLFEIHVIFNLIE
jgi:hypothetical protein